MLDVEMTSIMKSGWIDIEMQGPELPAIRGGVFRCHMDRGGA